MTVRELLDSVLRNIGVLPVGQASRADDIDVALTELNAMLDEWNAQGFLPFGRTIYSFTLVSGTDSYTIDTSAGTWTSQRPEVVDGCYLDDYGALNLIGEQEMGGLRVSDESGVPCYFWYDPEYPLGKCEFYPSPYAAYTGKLHYQTLFSEITTTTMYNTWAFPAGYKSAITWCLSERLQSPFGLQSDLIIEKNASRSLRVVRSRNAAAKVERTNLMFLNKLSTRSSAGSSPSSNIFTG